MVHGDSLEETQEVSKIAQPHANKQWPKAFHGSCGNLPGPHEGSIDHECPDSPDDVGEHSNSANTGKLSGVEKEHITMTPTTNNFLA